MVHLDKHRLLSDKQHAFRKWHSCETLFLTVIDDWAKILDDQGQVDTFIAVYACMPSTNWVMLSVYTLEKGETLLRVLDSS